eukprot:CAMPEP_0181234708 /NCGR_PEP_ID=MMETSP1096-20121128/37129_1 /TAXON_ID=156174 ORGANISM="Chrysochromulina ericina, Strain CCMP281" /NCGR_SAMPLE_ID=MMETSP1096 /ASSEMBLY_ACC=CAM_ASM_000453 /LENGTH=42 /DNA_ID= /DNA_START= /DNA_END= /DNA_ORIENTATION=
MRLRGYTAGRARVIRVEVDPTACGLRVVSLSEAEREPTCALQ